MSNKVSCKILIVDYDPEWPQLFRRAADKWLSAHQADIRVFGTDCYIVARVRQGQLVFRLAPSGRESPRSLKIR